MTDEKIIEYVMNSPENTNPSVLGSMLKSKGSKIQSDWNQNDSTAADYVKNRPFYTGDPVEMVWLEETTAEFTTDNDVIYQTPLNFELLKEGQTYSVSWDGTVYDCVCRLIDSAPFIGNLSIMRKGEDTGEPFVIGYEGWNLIAFTRDKSAFHTISISNTERVLLNEDTFKFDNKTFASKPVYSTLLFQVMKEGQTYGVSWDGIVYECVCTIVDHAACFGNLSIMDSSFPDTGEPFLIYGDNTALIAFTKDKSASHTISISYFDTQIVKIDEKYLPDSIISDINDAQSTADAAQSTANAAYTHSTSTHAPTNAEKNVIVGIKKNGINLSVDSNRTVNITVPTSASNIGGLSATNPTGTGSFSLNRKADTTVGYFSFAEGFNTTASGEYSHAEGHQTTASGNCSHAEGSNTTASDDYSHAEGWRTTASGPVSHAEGYQTTASGDYSHAEGEGTKASSKNQHVQGKYNVEDSSNTYIHIIGNGTSDTARSNAHTLDWSGNAWYAGTVEGDALILPSSTASSTKKFKITVDDSGTISATEVKQER